MTGKLASTTRELLTHRKKLRESASGEGRGGGETGAQNVLIFKTGFK
jgi:hypothetical protein